MDNIRLTKDELLDKFPSWNTNRHDIVKVFYGEIPLIEWNKSEYNKYIRLRDRTMVNIETVNAYIWTQNGDYSIYRTLLGDIMIRASGKVICGDLRVKCGGKAYNIFLNLMYGLRSLSIFRLNGTEFFIGFRNTDGMKSSHIKAHTKELEPELIEKVLSADISDYGESVKKFMMTAKALYESDKTNKIMCFA